LTDAAGRETPPEARTWIPLAEVMRPHGVRGEVRLRPYNRDSELLLDLDEVLVRFPNGEESEVTVEGVRPANDAILIKLCSVDDRNEAEQLRGAVVCGRRSEFPPVDDGEFYVCDIEGAVVLVGASEGAQTELGRVRELVSYPTVDVLIVDAVDGGRPWEVPLVDSVVRSVDITARRVTLAAADGIERA